MVNPKNTKSKDRATRPSTARETVIQRQRAKKRQESRAKAREVRKAKERETEIPLVPSNQIIKLNPKQQEGAWFCYLSSVLKWEEAPEVTFGEGPHLHVLYQEVLKQPTDLVPTQLMLGNKYHFQFEETRATHYAESLIRKFKWQGQFFDQ